MGHLRRSNLTFASAGSASKRRNALPPSFFVATNGNNAWTGLLPDPNAGNTDGPFLTLAAAQTAARASGTNKRVMIRAGTYTITGTTWTFTSADNGQYWVRYANESVIIEGGGSGKVQATGISGFTMKGLAFQNLFGGDSASTSPVAGFLLGGDSFSIRWNTFTNCSGFIIQGNNMDNSVIDSNTITGQTAGNFNGTSNGYSCIDSAGGSSNNTITHDLLQNVAGGGISFEAGVSEAVCDNNIIDRNLLINVCNNCIDNGALYFMDRRNAAVGNQITNNVVNGCGGVNHLTSATRALYLDDGSANVLLSGNLVYGNAGEWGIQFHGSTNCTIQNNVIAVSAGELLGFFQTSSGVGYNFVTMNGNTFTRNIVYYPTTCNNPQWQIGGGPTNNLGDTTNIYFSGNSSTIFNSAPIVDASPFLENPLFVNVAASNYQLQAGSPAYAHLTWVDLPTDQGPLAYVQEGVSVVNPNKVRNSIFAGGVAGSPGTLPTNCVIGGGTGLTRTIIGFGTVGGLPYFDIGFTGTASDTGLFITVETVATITELATWTSSLYLALLSGSMATITGRSLANDYSSSGGFITPGGTLGTNFAVPTGSLTRLINTQTTPATTIRTEFYIAFSYNASSSITMTLRIAAPQIELGAAATTFQPTP